jgi:subtilase family serine protease
MNMKTMLALSSQRWIRACGRLACGWLAACLTAAATLGAQTVAPRIHSEISSSEIAPMQGSRHPLAQSQFDAGRVPSNTRLTGISIDFNRSAAQQADLLALIAAQQDPSSPLFHQWLTPDQFGARFGMAQADLDKVQNWLLQQGFSIDSISRSRSMIRFSGTVAQAERAFSTELHYYNVQGERHIAPSSDLSLPSALAPVVLGIHNIDNFRPKAQVILNKTPQPRPAFTSSQTQNVYFAPGDVATAYNVAALYHSGYTGAGQSIAVVGQSAIPISDVENFQSAAGLNVNPPTLVLVPGSGSSSIYSGDETESDLDLEWSSAMAPGADIFFVYTGDSSTSNGVFDAISYAIDQKIGNIVSISYGTCEPLLGGFSLESTFLQASTQGQTVIAASGDDGSTACFVENPPKQGDPSLATQEELAVSYPASSPNVTAVGGTEITAANDTSSNSTYWNTANGVDLISSAKIHIPEVAWNDDSSSNGLSASGGGKSTLFTTKPTWQAALTPADGVRDVPDIALYASAALPGYLFCTSDSTAWSSNNQQASCNSGFRDSASGALTVAGGTSFGAPIFAGMLAIINQQQGYNTGTGNINPTLYKMATSAGQYSAGTIFYDVTSGNNECTAGSGFCSGSSTSNYSAGTGYDLVTGLGSIDLANLSGAWTASTSPLTGTTTSVSASNSSPAANASDTFTITVVGTSGTTGPTGSVTLVIDGGTALGGSSTTAVLSPSNTGPTSTATYSASFATAATHQVIAQYPGDATYAASTGVVSVSVGATSSGKGSFSVSAAPSTLDVTQGSSGNETISIVPSGGYTGTVLLTLNSSNNNALANLCYQFTTTLNNGDGSVVVSGASTVTTTLNLNTLPSSCGLAVPNKGNPQWHRLGGAKTARNNPANPAPMAVAFAGLLLVGFLGRYSRKFGAIAALFVMLAVGITLSACGGGGGGGTVGTVTPDPAKGTYTITVTGQDSTSSSIPVATTTFTFVIQ